MDKGADMELDMVADTEVDKVADMELDMVADMEEDKVAGLEVYMVADININIKFGDGCPSVPTHEAQQ